VGGIKVQEPVRDNAVGIDEIGRRLPKREQVEEERRVEQDQRVVDDRCPGGGDRVSYRYDGEALLGGKSFFPWYKRLRELERGRRLL
jgi:hypothetical protein